MKKNIIIALLLLLAFPQISRSQSSATRKPILQRTTFSILHNYSTGPYSFRMRKGLISESNGKSNPGLAVTRDFYFSKHLFFTTGIRLNTSESFIQVNTIHDAFNFRYTWFRYTMRHMQLTVPLYLGKTIKFSKDKYRYADLFGGTSLGIMNASFIMAENQGKKSRNDGEYVALTYPNSSDLGNNGFLATLDAGFRITPFNFPNLTVGVLASYNLMQSSELTNSGSFMTMNQGRDDFAFSFSRRYFNTMLQLNYSIGKKWKRSLRQ